MTQGEHTRANTGATASDDVSKFFLTLPGDSHEIILTLFYTRGFVIVVLEVMVPKSYGFPFAI